MKKCVSIILSVIILLACFQFSVIMTSADATSITSSLSIRWNNPPGTTTGNSVDYTPEDNSTMEFPIKLTFSLGNIDNVQAEEVKIKIPMYAFYDRSGNPVGQYAIPLPKKPEKSEMTSFYYDLDNEAKQIIITNFEPITSALMFKLDIMYSCYPTDIKDGFRNDSISATANIQLQNNDPIEITSDKLSLCVHTWARISSFSKYNVGNYDEWYTGFGNEPENSKDYFYQIWGLEAECLYTQPYHLTISDVMDSGFEFVGWKRTDDPSSTPNGQFTIRPYEEFVEEDFSSCWVIFRKKKPLSNVTVNYSNTASLTLQGVDGATDYKQATSSGEYTAPINPEEPGGYEYPGDSHYIGKGGYPREYSPSNAGINSLEKGLSLYPEYSIDLSASLWNKVNDPNNGQISTRYCTVDVEEGFYSLESTKLLPEDYTISKFYVTGTFYKEWIDQGNLISESSQTPPIKIFTQYQENEEWKLLYTAVPNVNNTCTFTDTNGNSFTEEECGCSLPETTKFIKIQFQTNLQRYDLLFHFYFTLYPTSHVLSLVRNSSIISLLNRANSTITDDAGNKNLKETSASLGITRQEAKGEIVKDCRKISSNPVIGLEEYQYEVLLSSDMLYNEMFIPTEKLMSTRLFDPLNSGIIYDLLPIGVSIVPSSIKLQQGTDKSTYKTIAQEYYTVDLKSNWRNSGQTMLIIKFDLTNPNIFLTNFWGACEIFSRIKLIFNIQNPWENIADNGPDFTNRAAYYSKGNMLYGDVFADDPSSLYSEDAKWEFFYDLNSDGNRTDDEFVVYVKNSSKQNALFASQYGFSKKVKSMSDSIFSQKTSVGLSGRYVYQLKFMTNEKASASGIVFYDILEDYYKNNEYWKGCLEYIDVSHALSKGISPVVYYSLNGNINPYGNSEHANLLNTGIWTTQKPQDLSTVKSIAIDLSKKTDGTPYVLNPEESLYCNIGMIAPGNGSNAEIIGSQSCNGGIIKANILNLETSDTHSLKEICVPTTVELKDSSVKIEKASNPITGTREAPTSLQADEDLVYTLSIINESAYESFQSIVVEDTIPSQLSVDTDNIKYYYGTNASNAKLLSETSDIQFEKGADNKLIFRINELGTAQRISFVIPTEPIIHSDLIENTAIITSLNGMSNRIMSNTTYHKLQPYPQLPASGTSSKLLLYCVGVFLASSGLISLCLHLFRLKSEQYKSGRKFGKMKE